MISAALFSSAKEDWGTPQWLFDACDRVFKFTLDAAASRENALCPEYFTKADNSLLQEWHESTWVNPPYGRGITGEFVAVAFRQAFYGDKTSVLLLPARTDVRWFHEFIYEMPRVSHRFIHGRLKFRGAESGAPFPSMLDEARAEASHGSILLGTPGMHPSTVLRLGGPFEEFEPFFARVSSSSPRHKIFPRASQEIRPSGQVPSASKAGERWQYLLLHYHKNINQVPQNYFLDGLAFLQY